MKIAITSFIFFGAGVAAWFWLCKWGEWQARGWDISHLCFPDGYAPDARARRWVSITIPVIGLWITAVRLATSGADLQTSGIILSLAALMAAAAATDIRFYMLPLPMTVTGIGLALLLASHHPSLITALSALYALVLIGVLWFTHKTFGGGVALGDYLALLWIALAAPLNGILTTGLALLAMAVLPRLVPKLSAWRQKASLPAGGIWLALAALIVAFPPFPEVIYGQGEAGIEPAPAAHQTLPAQLNPQQALVKALRLQALKTQSEAVGRVAMADTREGRIKAARETAPVVEQLGATYAAALTPEEMQGMARLAQALTDYDTDAVRDLSEQFAGEREQLEEQLR